MDLKYNRERLISDGCLREGIWVKQEIDHFLPSGCWFRAVGGPPYTMYIEYTMCVLERREFLDGLLPLFNCRGWALNSYDLLLYIFYKLEI